MLSFPDPDLRDGNVLLAGDTLVDDEFDSSFEGCSEMEWKMESSSSPDPQDDIRGSNRIPEPPPRRPRFFEPRPGGGAPLRRVDSGYSQLYRQLFESRRLAHSSDGNVQTDASTLSLQRSGSFTTKLDSSSSSSVSCLYPTEVTGASALVRCSSMRVDPGREAGASIPSSPFSESPVEVPSEDWHLREFDGHSPDDADGPLRVAVDVSLMEVGSEVSRDEEQEEHLKESRHSKKSKKHRSHHSRHRHRRHRHRRHKDRSHHRHHHAPRDRRVPQTTSSGSGSVQENSSKGFFRHSSFIVTKVDQQAFRTYSNMMSATRGGGGGGGGGRSCSSSVALAGACVPGEESDAMMFGSPDRPYHPLHGGGGGCINRFSAFRTAGVPVGNELLLPVLPSGHCQNSFCNSISSETLSRVIHHLRRSTKRSRRRSRHGIVYPDKLVVVDCRFPYEHEGGSIVDSVNIYQAQVLHSFFFMRKPESMERTAIVFFCEFSSHRGPKMYELLRRMDREVNVNHYPKLFFPQIYLLEGGYSDFYQFCYRNRLHYCNPMNYVKMKTKACQLQLQKAWKEMKDSERLLVARRKAAAFGNPHNPQNGGTLTRTMSFQCRLSGMKAL